MEHLDPLNKKKMVIRTYIFVCNWEILVILTSPSQFGTQHTKIIIQNLITKIIQVNINEFLTQHFENETINEGHSIDKT